MSEERKDQYQHFIPQFLLRNFSNDKVHIYKYEDEIWTYPCIKDTGGQESIYGCFNSSLEFYFGILEKGVAPIIKQHKSLSKKGESYIKLFIVSMLFRSPSRGEIINKNEEKFAKLINEVIPDNDKKVSFLENHLKELEKRNKSFEEDLELEKLTSKCIKKLCGNDNHIIFQDINIELLQSLPKLGKSFNIHIVESDYDLILGETPTMSVNLVTNEVKINGEHAGLGNENVIYWLPVAYNKLAFMYKNIFVIGDRKLRKEDVDILNYLQKENSKYYYSRKQKIEIPELPKYFDWANYFDNIFEYRRK
jgi:hypothetical protein